MASFSKAGTHFFVLSEAPARKASVFKLCQAKDISLRKNESARRISLVPAASADGSQPTSTEEAPVLPSGEWPENFSLLNFEDLSAHYHPQVTGEDSVVEEPDVPGEGKDAPENVVPSGEWAENFSMLNLEDLHAHYEPLILKENAQPGTLIANLMQMEVKATTASAKVLEVAHLFAEVTGIPVVDSDNVCIGVLSKADVVDLQSNATVGELMTSPPVTIQPFGTVQEAAVMMLKNKVHRLPVVNEENKLVGIVTRTDIFTALEKK